MSFARNSSRLTHCDRLSLGKLNFHCRFLFKSRTGRGILLSPLRSNPIQAYATSEQLNVFLGNFADIIHLCKPEVGLAKNVHLDVGKFLLRNFGWL